MRTCTLRTGMGYPDFSQASGARKRQSGRSTLHRCCCQVILSIDRTEPIRVVVAFFFFLLLLMLNTNLLLWLNFLVLLVDLLAKHMARPFSILTNRVWLHYCSRCISYSSRWVWSRYGVYYITKQYTRIQLSVNSVAKQVYSRWLL